MTGRRNPNSAWIRLFKSYRNMALRRGYEFSISCEELKAICSSDCFYCGSPPSRFFNGYGKCASSLLYNGIDRVDNSIGYTPGNSVACCSHCNIAKRDRSVVDFVQWIHKASDHLRGDGGFPVRDRFVE